MSLPDFSLQGRVALLTGSAQGLGLAIARAYGAAGATVIINGRDADRTQQASRRLLDEGYASHAWVRDMSELDSLAQDYDALCERCGVPDILVNNVGIRIRKTLAEISLEEITALLHVDLTSATYLSKLAAQHMVRQGGAGRIISLSSIADRVARPGDAVYPIAKHGISGLVRALAVEYGARNITSNGIAPGTFATESNLALAMDPEKVPNMSTPLRLAINGYGRIGRCFLRALYETLEPQEFEIVAINEPAPLPALAHLTRFDSTHGPFPGKVSHDENHLIVDGKPIAVWHERTPEAVPWRELDVDILVECSGQYATRVELERFLAAGCRRVLLSNPGRSVADVDTTLVYGINHQQLDKQARIVSAASCTTNAVVPVLDRIHHAVGIEHVFLTTLHSVMNDQPLLDGYHHDDLRYTRSAIQSFVPVPTGLARGVERLLPALQGKVLAKAIRVPTLNVSSIDVMLQTREAVTEAQVNQLMAQASAQAPTWFGYTDCAQASVDFNHCPLSTVFDASQTRVNGSHLLNVLVWFDNEWGFANRLLDLARFWRGQFD